MSSQATSTPRVFVVDDHGAHEVFDVIGLVDRILRVRTSFLFEIGEELRVRVEQDGDTFDATARIRRHVGQPEAPVTEIELSERSDVRRNAG